MSSYEGQIPGYGQNFPLGEASLHHALFRQVILNKNVPMSIKSDLENQTPTFD